MDLVSPVVHGIIAGEYGGPPTIDDAPMEISIAIQRSGGLVATHELYALGWSKRQIAAAVFREQIVRVRQGWYCLPSAPIALQQAARVGGRLGCCSGARAHGLAVRDSTTVHVSVRANSTQLRSPTDKHVRLTSRDPVRIHWCDTDANGDRLSVSARECLRQMATCQTPERTVAAVESAMRFGFLRSVDWLSDIAHLTPRLRNLLADVEPLCESITESITRFRLIRLGIDVTCQVRIGGVGRVDFVVGTRLVIEVDGYQFHADRERFERDRRRDAQLSIRGFRVLRFSYDQVFNRWAEVRGAIEAAIDRNDHLR